MRVFYIIGMSLAFLLIIIFAFVANQYESYDRMSWYNYSYDSNPFSNIFNDYSNYRREKDTMIAIYYFFTFIMFAWFLTVDILGLAKIKRTTTKVLSIIGICLTGIIGFAAVGTALGEADLQDIFVGWILYLLVMLAFSIVGLIQAVKWSQGKTKTAIPVPTGNPSDLDFFK